jgi:hypothetical protein
MYTATSGRVDWNMWTVPLKQIRCRSSKVDCPTKDASGPVLVHLYSPTNPVMETDLGNNGVSPHIKVYSIRYGRRIATSQRFVQDEYHFSF